MKPIIHIHSVSEIARFVRQDSVKHPLVTIIDFSKAEEYLEEGMRISCDFYCVMFKNYCGNNMRYGRKPYDFQEGSLVCIAPRQVVSMDKEVEKTPDMLGWGLFFHPDLIRGTSLDRKMKEYSFFSYETAEALHLSEKEKQTLFDCVQKISNELKENIDNHSLTLIVSNIELLLNYCARYYGRQFITRKNENNEVVASLQKRIKQYFNSEDVEKNGLPTVKYFADQVHLSPNYLSDLLKKETGMNAQDHIHYFLIEEAKGILLNSDKTVGEIAYSLGFEYPQYFSKLFRQKTGSSPQEFRKLN